MPALKKPSTFETTFNTYIVEEIVGEGGSGRVYGGRDAEGNAIAVKVLTKDRATADKRRRFQREVEFLRENRHPNIVTIIDNGLGSTGEIQGPFCVMTRYDGSLRDLMRVGIDPANILPFFSQILNGVEAAHLKGVIHRDLKPENILYARDPKKLAVADFGIARFTEHILSNPATAPDQRLANFQYAAPEQRTPGASITTAADIHALGSILNEMFTRTIPHGTGYRTIAQVSPANAFLDSVVEKMIRQTPEERPSSIGEVKGLIQRYNSEAVSLQKLSQLDGTVVDADVVDHPLAKTPPKLINAEWADGVLTLKLDRKVTPDWIQALNRMSSYSSLQGKPPAAFDFIGDTATVIAGDYEAQALVDYFKAWLPQASLQLRSHLEGAARMAQSERKTRLERERVAEEKRLQVNRALKI